MNLKRFPQTYLPLYVLITGTVGSFLPLLLFRWNYPKPGDAAGQEFVSVPEFWVWIFLWVVLFAMLAIFFIPAWLSLINIFKVWVLHREGANIWGSIITLVLGTIFILAFLWVINSLPVQLDFQSALPEGHRERVIFINIAILLVVLPIAMVIQLLYGASQVININIDKAGQDENKLFLIIEDVVELRHILQRNLLIAGIILGMVPIVTAGLRAILFALKKANDESWPITLVFAYGLAFTLILIFIYAPTHLALTECSRKLRDNLCSIDSLATLEESMAIRNSLDELLQTNMGLGQNLKAGIATLTPIISSLLVSLLGITL